MKLRTTPRVVPDRAPYIDVQVPDSGLHQFKVPSMIRYSRIMDAIGATAMSEAGSACALHGVLIGTAWYHESLDLDSEQGDDLFAWGEAVFEELHDAGYGFDHLVLISTAITVMVTNQTKRAQEVQERADFFSIRGSMTSSPSTLESTTSETPGASAA